jgi:hypothetical protein
MTTLGRWRLGRHGSFPPKRAGDTIEREQLGVVGHEEHLVAAQRDAAIGAKL